MSKTEQSFQFSVKAFSADSAEQGFQLAVEFLRFQLKVMQEFIVRKSAENAFHLVIALESDFPEEVLVIFLPRVECGIVHLVADERHVVFYVRKDAAREFADFL